MCIRDRYNLVPVVKGWWRSLAGKVTSGQVESTGSLPPSLWLCHLRADCLTGSAPALRSVLSTGCLYLYLFYLLKNYKLKSSICYSASYMRRTQDQKRFTILEVAADWHELMIPQRTMQPSNACMNKQLDPWFAASWHTIITIGHTRPSPCSP